MGKSDSKERRVELTANIWKGIEHPWLLGTVGALVLLLYLCALLVPQMPGQLRDDPAGAARWILVMSETYGPWGGVLRTLGLFTVLHNPLLQLLVILIALVLFVQLGSSIANLRRLYQLENGPARRAIPEQTDRAAEQTTAAVAVGEPLALPATQRLFRARLADNQSPAKLSAALSTYLADDFDEVWHTMRTVAAKFSTVEPPAPQPPQPDDVPVETDASAEQVREEQLWALRAGRQALLRPLLFIGMFLALVAVWFTLVWGWEVTPPPLAPGAEYRSTSRGLFLQYLLEQSQSPTVEGEQEDGEGPQLVVFMGSETLTMTIGTGTRVDFGQLHVRNRLGPPALFMRTLTKTAMVSRLGQTQMVPSMGLVFPGPGSEESVVINQALGLRIVRLAGNEPIQPEQFLVEIYDVRANEVVNRIPVQQATQTEVLVDEEPVVVEFVPLPSLLVDVTYQPGIWLLWPALICVLIGLVGYACKPAFVSVQFAPWPLNRTVVVVQSDVEGETKRIVTWFNEQQRVTDQ